MDPVPILLGELIEGGIGGTSGQCDDAAGPKVSRALSIVQTWAHISKLVNKHVCTHTHRHTHTLTLLSTSPSQVICQGGWCTTPDIHQRAGVA